MDSIKTPGPDHPITLSALPRRARVRYEGHVIADSADVLVLKEAGYQPVSYFPRSDVAMAFLSRTDRDTHCPYKGHARYFTLAMDGHIAENAVWSYEDPYPAMELIRGRLAFFPNQVEIEEYGEDVGASVAEVIRHTDEGDGASQKAHWPATASQPTAD